MCFARRNALPRLLHVTKKIIYGESKDNEPERDLVAVEGKLAYPINEGTGEIHSRSPPSPSTQIRK